MKKRIALVIFSLLMVWGVQAQWQTTGPYGGQVNAMVKTSTSILAATNVGGIYRSTDGGNTWTNTSAGFTSSFQIQTIVASPTSVFISYGNTIYKSTNDGLTWALSSTGLTGATTIYAIYSDGTDLYAGDAGGKLFKSTNDGASWTLFYTFPASTFIKCMWKNGSEFLVGAYNTGVFQSLDNGLTWTAINNGFGTPSLINVPKIIMHGADLYASINYVIFKKGIGSTVWTPIPVQPGSGATELLSDGSSLYAGFTIFSAPGTSNLYKSINNGSSWSLINTGLAAGSVYSLLLNGSNNVLAAVGGEGIYQTNNGGASWFFSSLGMTSMAILDIELKGSQIFVSSPHSGIYKSTDAGITWFSSDAGMPLFNGGSVQRLHTYGNDLFALCGQLGVYKSNNDGLTWAASNSGLSIGFGIDAIGSTTNELWCTNYSGTVYKSTSNGTSWTSVAVPVKAASTRTTRIASSGSTVFLVTSGEGIIKSDDGGMTWIKINTGLPSLFCNDLAASSGGILYAAVSGSGNNLYKSLDNGQTWQNFFPNFGGVNSITRIVLYGQDIFVASAGGLYRLSENSTCTQLISKTGVVLNTDLTYDALVYNNTLFASYSSAGLYHQPYAQLPAVNVVSTSAISGPASVCPNQAQVSYSVNATPGSIYIWSVPPGAFIASGNSTNSIKVNFGNTPGDIRVSEINNSCYGATVVKAVSLGGLTTSAVSGMNTVCGNQTGVTYSVTSTFGATYAWSVPAGATIVSGQGTNSINVNFGTSSGNVSVVESIGTCSNTPSTLSVTVNALAPLNIGGPPTLCENQTNVFYSVANNPGSTYAWTVPAGFTINQQGGFYISVNAGTAGGQITCQETNNGCSGSVATYSVAVNPPLANPVISGPSEVCQNQSGIVYSVTNHPGSTYSWSVPPTAILVSGQGTSSITVDFASGSGNVSVTEYNAGYCNSASAYKALTVQGFNTSTNPAVTICTSSTRTFQFSTSGATSYVWNVPADALVVSGAGTDVVDIKFGQLGGLVVVNAYSSAGCPVGELVYPIVMIPGVDIAPVINGPSTVCANLAAQYSIASPNAGSVYHWGSTFGNLLAGDLTPSATIQNTGVDPMTVTVFEEKTNGCKSNLIQFSSNVVPSPTPLTISGPVDVCKGQTGVVYSVQDHAGSTYAWTLPSGLTLLSGQGTSSITVDVGLSAGTISVIETNSGLCNGPVATQNITAHGAIYIGAAPAQSACENAVLTLNANIANAVSYNWTVPSGSTVVSGGNTANISVQLGNTSGNIQGNGIDAFGCSVGVMIFPITNIYPALTQAPVITGPTSVCANSNYFYSALPASGPGAAIQWVVQNATIVNYYNGNTMVEIKTGTNPALPPVLKAKEYSVLGCPSPEAVYNVVLDVPAAPVISGLSSVCEGVTSISYNITSPQAGITYTWTVSPQLVIQSGQGTSTIIVSTVNSGIATIGVTAGNTNGCSSNSAPFTVNVREFDVPPIASISGASSVCVNTTANYFVAPRAGSTFTWTVPAGATILSGQGTNAIIVKWGTTSGNISVVETGACGGSSGITVKAVTVKGYGIASVNVYCNSNSFCVPVHAFAEVSPGVIGLDFTIYFDATKMTPTGTATMGPVATAYGSYSLNTNISGRVSATVYLNNAPAGVFMKGTGEVICIGFTKLAAFTSSANIMMPVLVESTPLGTQSVCGLGSASFVPVNPYMGQLNYMGSASNTVTGNSRTEIQATNTTCLGSTKIGIVDNAGVFRLNPTSATKFKIYRDVLGDANVPVLSCTNVQSVINATDRNLAADISTGKYQSSSTFVGLIRDFMFSLIASDVNRDGKVTAGDVSLISSRSINQYNCEFPQQQNYEWNGTAFVPKSNYTPSTDWLFVSRAEMNSFVANYSIYNKNFLPVPSSCFNLTSPTGTCNSTSEVYDAILLGDANRSWVNSTNGATVRAHSTAVLTYELNQTSDMGNAKYSIPVYAKDLDSIYQGLDFTIDYDQSALRVVDVRANTAISGLGLMWNDISGDRAMVTCYASEALPTDQPLMFVEVEVLQGNILPAHLGTTEAYINDAMARVNYGLEEQGTVEDQINVQAYPNPFTGATQVLVSSNEELQVEYTLMNATGVILNQGNWITNQANSLGQELPSGMYLLKIVSGKTTEIVKIVKE